MVVQKNLYKFSNRIIIAGNQLWTGDFVIGTKTIT